MLGNERGVGHLPFFVYGTLLPGERNYALVRPVVTEARPAVFHGGRLHHLGRFPMLVEAEEGVVRGMVLEVEPAYYDSVLVLLDTLEGFRVGVPGESLYHREARPVTLDDGRQVAAWVYLGRPEVAAGFPVIESGYWLKQEG